MLNILAEFFEIDVSELLNGEKGTKKDIDIDKAISEAIEKYKNIEEKRKKKINKNKKMTGIVSTIILIISLYIKFTKFIKSSRTDFDKYVKFY